MSYAVKEIFRTLQGEGAHSGRPAVFLRFAGCNLWTGRQADRHTATCRFCDTDFLGTDGPGGGRFATAVALAQAVRDCWDCGHPGYVVCTGGEPLLQLDVPLLDALHAIGMTVAVETNGTLTPPPGVDWLCVSPKAGASLRLTAGDELKVVHPQDGLDLEELAVLDFGHHYLQPLATGDPAADERHRRAAVEHCLRHPRWKLSLQTHKLLGIR